MADLDYTRMRRLVKDVASSVSRSFPSYVTSEDTEGHLWVHMYENKSWFSQVVQEGDGWEARIAAVLRKQAAIYCAKEKAAVEGYSPEDLFRYTIPKLRDLLADAFEYENWQSFGLHGDGQPTAKVQANRTGDRIAELADVKSACDGLDVDTYNLLVLHYRHHYTMPMLAEVFDVTEETAKKRTQRAVVALQKQLGRKDYDPNADVTGSRTVRSNAASRADASNHYEN